MSGDLTVSNRLFVTNDVSLNGNLYVAKNVGLGVSGSFGVYDVCNNAQMVLDISGGVNLRGPVMGGLILPDNSVMMTATPPLDLSNNFGTVWRQATSDATRNWYDICISATGQYQTAVVNGGYIYTSNNFGVTWVQDTSIGATKNYNGIGMSKSGQYQTVLNDATGYIYTSSNYGVTWIANISAGTGSWVSVSISATGQYQIIGNTAGKVYISNNYGITWTPKSTIGSGTVSVSISGTGQYQTAVIVSGYIYSSNDYGNTWTQDTSIGASRIWNSVSISANGQYQTAVANSTTSNGYIYTSNNYGVTWRQATSDANREWTSVSMSANGQYQAATVFNVSIYTSNNYGVTWRQQTSSGSRSWRGISISADGQYISAAASSSYIYTSVTPYNDLVAQNSLISYCDASLNNRLFVGSDASINGLTLGKGGGNISTNTVFGYQALTSNTTGTSNTAIGYQAGYAGTSNTTGSNNTYIGYQAKANANNYSNSTALGSGATITASNQVVLGTSTEKVITLGDASMNKRLFVGSDASFGGNIGFNKTITVSPNSTNATSDSWSSSGITWTATASTYDPTGTIRNPYKQFNSDTTYGAGWGTSTASYNTTTPFAYKNTTYSTVIQNSVGTVYGEWLQIASNVPVTLNSFYLYNTQTSSTDAGNAPGKYYICGSSNGTTWYPIIYVNYTSYPSGNTSLQTPTWSIPSGSGSGTTTGTINTSYTVYGNSNTTYTYFRMVVTNCVGNLGTGMTNNGYCFFGEWNMSFTAASSNNLYISNSLCNTIQSDNSVILGGTMGFTYSTPPSFTPSHIGYFYQGSLSPQRVGLNSVYTTLLTITGLVGVYIINIDTDLYSPGQIGGTHYTTLYIKDGSTTLSNCAIGWGGTSSGNYANRNLSLTAFTKSNNNTITFGYDSTVDITINTLHYRYMRIA
jgi:hypothetical protein